LPSGQIWDSWFKKPLAQEGQWLANGYANGWWINLDEIKNRKGKNYMQNPDGSIDFEIMVEFWPQRLFYVWFLGLFFTCLFFAILYWRHQRRSIRRSVNSQENDH